MCSNRVHNSLIVQTLDITQIMAVLPHRYPLLLLDRVVNIDGNKVVGLKNVTINEAHFVGHYPGIPIMPGVLILEFLAQTGAVILLIDPKFAGSTPVIGAMDKIKFRRQVVPGDQLIGEVELTKLRGTVGWTHGVAKVDGKVVAEMDMTFKLIPAETPSED